jgi:predicted dehydrogenase
MGNRRDFIKGIGGGVISSAALISSSHASTAAVPEPDLGTGKKVRVGIIGAENSHTVNFGRMFNVEKKFPGVEVVAVWGETDEFAKRAAERGSIPKIVKEQKELMGIIDALIIDHRHAKYHAAAAVPFVEAGIPTFVDKPFTYRVQEAQHLLDLAKKHNTPITCLSGLGIGPGVDDMAAQVAEMERIGPILVTGPADVNSKYGGIFFYSVHFVERMFKVFGDDVVSVRATRHGPHTGFQYKFASGHLATAFLANSWNLQVLTKEGWREIKPRDDVEDRLYMYAAIVRMFQTGEEPRTHESILKVVSTLEAMERSVSSEDWEMLVV